MPRSRDGSNTSEGRGDTVLVSPMLDKDVLPPTYFIPGSALGSLSCLPVRYMAIVYPLKPRLGRKNCCVGIGLIWIAAAVFGVPSVLFSKTIR